MYLNAQVCTCLYYVLYTVYCIYVFIMWQSSFLRQISLWIFFFNSSTYPFPYAKGQSSGWSQVFVPSRTYAPLYVGPWPCVWPLLLCLPRMTDFARSPPSPSEHCFPLRCSVKTTQSRHMLWRDRLIWIWINSFSVYQCFTWTSWISMTLFNLRSIIV